MTATTADLKHREGPALAPVLVGLGVTSLSMSASAVADVRDSLAAVSLAECRELAAKALTGVRPA